MNVLVIVDAMMPHSLIIGLLVFTLLKITLNYSVELVIVARRAFNQIFEKPSRLKSHRILSFYLFVSAIIFLYFFPIFAFLNSVRFFFSTRDPKSLHATPKKFLGRASRSLI